MILSTAVQAAFRDTSRGKILMLILSNAFISKERLAGQSSPQTNTHFRYIHSKSDLSPKTHPAGFRTC